MLLDNTAPDPAPVSSSNSPEATKLLSTILYASCSFFLLDLHVERLRQSTRRLGWVMPDEMEMQRALYGAIMGRAHLTLRLRLTMARDGKFEVEVTEIAVPKNLLGPFADGEPNHIGDLGRDSHESSQPWTVFVDTHCTRTKDLLPLIENKTTSRSHYTEPMTRCRAAIKDCQEVLLYNEREEVTEGTITNVIFRRGGRYVTPSASCGLLDGVVRRSLLDRGKIHESIIHKDDLIDGELLHLCNAVRGVFPAMLRLGPT